MNFGASVRAAQFLVLAAKARALMKRRYHVTYEDIRALAMPVLRHRILLNFHRRVRPAEAGRHPAPPAGADAGAERRVSLSQRFLDPEILAGISGLDLVAKTVVDGFIAGLHRSPDFGFSQEFAEYRAYSEGDDLRHVDWNVFARTERCYLKRYRGETNTRLTLLLDASASMGYGSHRVNKLEYARFLAASLFYLAHQQRDAAGLIVFDDEVRNHVAPSSRQGQLMRLLHASRESNPARAPISRSRSSTSSSSCYRPGIVVVISDFYAGPGGRDQDHRAAALPRQRADSVPRARSAGDRPDFRRPVLLVDMESEDAMDVSPEYAQTEYRAKIDAHIEALRTSAKRAGMDYFLLDTSRPLDEGAARVSGGPAGEDVDGPARSMVSGGTGGGGAARLAAPAAGSTRARRCPSAR